MIFQNAAAQKDIKKVLLVATARMGCNINDFK